MIMDNLYTTLADYGSISPKVARAIEWLKSNDIKALEPGQTITVDGDRISAQIQAYDSIAAEETRFEAHRRYIDIQIVLSGSETIYWAPLARTPKIRTAYNYDNDVVFFEDPEVSVALRLDAGDFAIFFPSDAHKPRCIANKREKIAKIVVKVAT